MKQIAIPLLFMLLFSWNLSAQVTMQKEAGGLLFVEKGEKVLFYQIEPKNYEGKYERSNYIHPLWNVDGAVLTEDFPIDHLHHRGIFWAWHQVWIDGKRIGDPWEIKDFDQKVTDIEFWAQKDGSALLKTKVNWLSDQWKKSGQKMPYLEESTAITIHPKTNNYRRIDFEISLLALEKGLSVGGSEDEKGYSGFSVRMVLPGEVSFTGHEGKVQPQNTAVHSHGYINISGSIGKNGKNAGIVIVDNPSNPGYPQPWILRTKNSMQNAAFPGNGTVPVLTSVPLVMKYSLLVYSGKMNDRKIRQAMDK
ncbi:MAG: PmoA family protein [Mariniphaga sp.]|nr:PmoA family protein [Mariniphaga sp.]